MPKNRCPLVAASTLFYAFLVCTAASVATEAHADPDFIGFDAEYTFNDQNNYVITVYAVFDNADAVVGNVFNSDIAVSASGFIHNDVFVGAGGTWQPSASLDIPNFSDSGNDSYVTIGYGVGADAATNSTSLDPGFGSGLGGTIPVGAGWFNGNPPNEQVVVPFFGGLDGLSGFAGKVGQFVIDPATSSSGALSFSFDAEIGSNVGAESEYVFGQDLIFVNIQNTDSDGDGIPDEFDPCPTWPGDCSEDGQTLFVGSDDGAEAIQLALTAVPEGGTVRVGPGTYAGPIDFAGKAVTLEATPDPQAGSAGAVILDGTGLEGSIVLATSGEGPDTVLRGFVLQNGITGSDPIAPSSWDYTVAGALYVHASSPTIENCVFRNCAADSAGAAYFFDSESVVSGCSFFDNVSGRSGGGLQLQVSNLTVEDCVFTGNQAAVFGGAIHNWSGSSSFIGCTITGNTSNEVGGGMSFFWNSSTTGNGTIENCVITDNTALVEGGGLMLSISEGITPDWLLVGNTTLCNNTPENTNSNATAPFVDLGGNCISEVCDSDSDGTKDCDDDCPDDPAKTEPGDCGCGVTDTDTDGDGILDCYDPCPTWPGDCTEDGQTFFVGSDDGADAIQLALTAVPEGGTVQIGPGTYLLDATIDTNGKAVTIRGAVDPVTGEPITILDGQGAHRVLQCLSGEGPDTVFEDLVIRGGNATGSSTDNRGGGMYNSNNSSPTLINCTFTNNSAEFGGGMFNNDSSPALIECTFTNNSAENNGGGMNNTTGYLGSSFPTLTNCSFTDNSAGNKGGGMVNTNTTVPTLTNCLFTNNSAVEFGGGIYNSLTQDMSRSLNLSNCTFTDNSAEYGGGMYNNQGFTTLFNCVFDNNTAEYGGGMYDSSSSSHTLNDCTFTNNTGEQNGGGIYLHSDDDSTVTNCTFKKNSAIDGGGIYLSVFSSGIRIENCSFCENTGGSIMGGWYFNDGSNCMRNICSDLDGDGRMDCTESTDLDLFVPSEYASIAEAIDAAPDGAVIRVESGTYQPGCALELLGKAITILGSVDANGIPTTILDGQNTHRIFMCLNGERSDTVLENLVIMNGHTLGNGGGMYMGSRPTLTNCILTNNSAEQDGGGMYTGSSPTLTNCTFSRNSANENGGGISNPIFNSSSECTLIDCTFVENSAGIEGGGAYGTHTITNSIFSGNSASYGGGIYADECTINDSIFCENYDGQIRGTYTDAGGNCISNACSDINDDGRPDCTESTDLELHVPSEYGSIAEAIDVAADGAVITIESGNYQPGSALELFGKSITIRGSVNANGTPATILDGQNTHRLFMCENAEESALVFENLVIQNGYTTGSGGGMYSYNSSPTLTNCTFTNNSAESGGGMYNYRSSPNITNCTFTDNSAESGGGIYNYFASSPTLTQCTFTNNSAGDGGGIYSYSPSGGNSSNLMILTNCSFSDNASSNDGGGIKTTGYSPTTFNDCTFTNNSAGDNGGGMYIRGGGTLTNCTILDNSAGDNGGGMYIRGGGTLTNCTLSDNSANLGGGLYTYLGSPTLTDTTICENTPNQISGPYTDNVGNCIAEVCTDCTPDPCPDWPYDCSEDGQTLTISVEDGAEAIQLALTVVPEGGTVLVGPGTYLMTEPLDFDGKAVVLEADSDPGAGEVILDGTGLEGSIVLAISGEGPDTVLRGFVLQNGITGSDPIAPTSWDYNVAGALYVHASSPTIENCVFRNCAAGSAGAAYFFDSESVVSGCSFFDNVSGRSGGGLQLQVSNLTVEDCVFTGNQAAVFGGAIHNWSGSSSFIGCTITGNTSNEVGGGMSFFWSASTTGNGTIENCVITDNTALVEGGGLMLSTSEDITPDWLLVGNTTLCSNTPENTNANPTAPFVDLGGNCISEFCDSDDDGTLDCLDNCPDDPNKTEPGDCGCGVADTDTDGDGILDCDDPCPSWPYDCPNEGGAYLVLAEYGPDAIQLAITDAPNGGTIDVGPGTYLLNATIDTNGKAVTIRGAVDPVTGDSLTVLDGQGKRILECHGEESESTSFESLIFTGGRSSSGGGAVSCSASPSFINCDFISNGSEEGGAVSSSGNPFFQGCVFAGNFANDYGSGEFASAGAYGGAFAGTGRFFDCVFSGNSCYADATADTNPGYSDALAQGGACDSVNSTYQNCVFIDNTVEAYSYGGCCLPGFAEYAYAYGGAVFGSENTFEGCTFRNNSVRAWGASGGEDGSAIYSTGSFSNSLICEFGSFPDAVVDCWDEGGNCVSEVCNSDSDGDSTLDCYDDCPDDPNKTEPGDCGCGVADTDSDSDGTPNCLDNCPDDPNKIEPGECGCGVSEVDSDSDGTPDCLDNCPDDADKTEPGECGCGVADTDSDSDGTPDCLDNCPTDPAKTEPGDCGCGVAETDTDGDGIPDCIDPCPTWPGTCSEDGQTLFVGSDDGADAIQLALTIIPEGGTISVGPGTYAGPIDFAGKAVTLEATPDRQAGPAGEVILDGTGLEGSIVLAISGEGPDTVLRGFVLQNGITGSDPIAPTSWDYNVAGALYVHASSPTIENCVFRNCAAGSAGAAYFFDSESVVSGCSFFDNVSGRSGGGLQLQVSNLTVEDCVFTGNQAAVFGGAIHNWSGSSSFIGCTITGNTSNEVGGGMSFFWSASTTGNGIVEDCVITRNVAQVEGGGLMLSTDEGITPDWLLVGNTTLCNNTPENTNPNAGAPFVDLGGNQICGCPGDLNFDAQVDGQDLAELLSKWGVCTSDDPTACFADINGDGVVGGPDLTIILSRWGVCVN